jgi:adenylate kinase
MADADKSIDSVFLPSSFRADKYNYSDHPGASFILDGFPRTAAQALQIDNLIPINMVVNIHTPSEIIIDRISNRWVHAPSGRVYNTTFNPPKVPGKDDVTGEPLTRREDDNPEVWKARLKQFKETSESLLEHYDKLGVLWTVQGNSSDEITPQILKEFGKRFGILDS